MDFETGMYILNKTNNHIGLILNIYKSEFDVEDLTDEVDDVWNIQDIEFLPPYVLDGKTIKNIVTFNQDVSQITPSGNVTFNCKSDGSYTINCQDILEGIQNILAEIPLLYYFAEWFHLIDTLREEIGVIRIKHYESLDENEILFYTFVVLEECLDTAYAEKKLDIERLELLEETLVHFQKERELPIEQRWISEDLMKKVILLFDSDTLDSAPSKAQDVFALCLDRLCEKGFPKALQKKGYCLYVGCKKYPQNWSLCRDLFVQYYQLTGDASAANTLGYIFYYGRSNHGKPEYDKAFYYFSIGHAHGYFESTYKLADMFCHGYGVVKNDETAFRLYSSLYKENLKRFVEGEKDGKFADVALRMGNCYAEGIGTEINKSLAYGMYLQAEYAIRQRLEYKQYGDTNVAVSIQNALTGIQKEFGKPKKTYTMNHPYLLQYALEKHRQAKMKWKKFKDGSYSLQIIPLPFPGESDIPEILLTIPEAGFCRLCKDIYLRLKKDAKLVFKNDANEIVFDYFEYDDSYGRCDLFFHNERVGVILSDTYVFKAPSIPVKKGNKIHFVRICFKPGGRIYDYVCDFDVKKGDTVIVDGYDGETEVSVVDLYDQYESECILPIERYHKIKRKK